MHNEDAVLLRDDLGLFLLADGAGGHEAGNVASALATTTVAHHFESTEKEHAARPELDAYGVPVAARRLSASFHRAHHEIVEVAKASNRHRGMGTTLVAAWFEARTGRLHIAHVGDSRCYRLRGGVLEPLTHDHSLLNEVIEVRPDIDEAVLAKLPRHVVTRALGMVDVIRVDVRSYKPLAGDKYLLCSDGLHGVVPEDQMAEALAIERIPEEQARLLIEMGKEAGSRDNVSALVVELQPLPNMISELLAKPRPRPEMPQKPMVTEESVPEIVVMEEWLDEPTERLHVLPAEAASPAVVDALDGFFGRRPPRRKT
ncbi:MAG: PP2C family protein-serine/threonine phosphatase [Polyangiales bacterium]